MINYLSINKELIGYRIKEFFSKNTDKYTGKIIYWKVKQSFLIRKE